MEEFIRACFAWVNVPYTTAVTIMTLYWFSVILGVLDWNILGDGHAPAEIEASVDADLDAGGDASLEASADGELEVSHEVGAEAHAEVEVSHGWFSGMKLFTIGDAPMTVFLSFLAIVSWAISLLTNQYLHNTSLLMALVYAFPILLVSFVVARVAAFPFGLIFRSLSKDLEHHEKIVGKTCVITTSRADEQFGQAEVRTHGAPHVFNVRTQEGVVLKEGDTALIIRHDKQGHLYIVRPYPYDPPDLDTNPP